MMLSLKTAVEFTSTDSRLKMRLGTVTTEMPSQTDETVLLLSIGREAIKPKVSAEQLLDMNARVITCVNREEHI